MAHFWIPVLVIFFTAFGQLDTSKLGNNTWVSIMGPTETFSITSGNWAYENDLQSHPFYGFFIMGPGHFVHPQDCKFYPFDPLKKKWTIIDPPTLPPRRCLSSFVVNSQDTVIIQLAGAEASHQQSQGGWGTNYSGIDMGGKRRGMWAYSFNRNEWYHILGPFSTPSYDYLPSVQYDPVHDLLIAPIADTTYLYNFHANSLSKLKTSMTFPSLYYSTAVDTKRGLAYAMTNNTLYKFDPETQAWSAMPGTHPPCPVGAADGNGTGLNQLAYDEINDVLLYTGDDNTAGGAPNINTWIFYCDSLKWMKMSPAAAPLDRGRLAYNRALNAFMLLGGTANAWISRGGSAQGIWIYRYKRAAAAQTPALESFINTLGTKPLLKWKHVSGAAGYNIYRGIANPYPRGYQKLNASPVTDTFYQDASAASATAYAYRICAVQNSTEGLMSRILYAGPGVVLNVVASVEDTHRVRISWDPRPTETVTGYNVYEASGAAGFTAPFPGSYVKLNASPVAGTEYADSVPAGVFGYPRVYVVKAVNGLGLEGGVSHECTTYPNSLERACVFSVPTSQGTKMVFHWQPPKRTRIAGVNVYHIHPDSEATNPALVTVQCVGADYFLQPGEPGHMSATRINGTRTAPMLITDTVTQWPMPPAPQDNTGFDLQTETYIARAVNIMGREGFGTDQISPNNMEFGNGIVMPSSIRYNNSDWSPNTATENAAISHSARMPDLSVWPNPLYQQMKVTFNAAGNGTARIAIINLAGQRVSFRALPVKPGLNSADFHLSGTPSGIYVIEVLTGNKRLTARTVVTR